MTRELQVAYLAGVMDSDGWFTIHKHTSAGVNAVYSPDLGINQATPECVSLAFDLWEGKLGKLDFSKSKERHSRKPMFTWKPHKWNMTEILEELIPHLRIKHEKAKILLRLKKDIDFHKGNSWLPDQTVEFREKLFQQFKGLNATSAAETECWDPDNHTAQRLIESGGLTKEQIDCLRKRQSDLSGNTESSSSEEEPLQEAR